MSQPTRILLALVLGIGLGIIAARIGGDWVASSTAIAEPIGGAWLNALQMTIVPLVVSLLITGIAASAEAARASKLAARALVLFITLLWMSAATAALLTPLFLGFFPMPAEAAAALRDALSTTSAVGAVPSFSDFVKSIVPTNPVGAAASSAILPLIIFTGLFAFAMTQLPTEPREVLVGFFKAVADTMLVVIGWVLWIGPIGVFALAYVVGARAGGAAFGALLHYVLIVSAVGLVVSLMAYPLAVFGAKIPFLKFARSVAPAQAVAVSTQSSLASLPAMLRASKKLGVPVAASGVVLPMAVAIFRATGPVMNLAVAIYVAHWFGIELTPTAMAAGVAAAAITTMGAVGIAGQASFITSIAPIAMAMGVPIEPLALLIAVETLPDLVRTYGNVSMDVAATATIAHRSGYDSEDADTREDRLLAEGTWPTDKKEET
ncbi:dicarboxylate/amino acid:cation symporter [Allosphingosinicella indica]|uniref:Na+/H+-dicarboxylate symporter n=1 Tax=Allosphingosinicella indica TaxID=941907 RepID=A0A1X7FZL1_9SPHN|nr:cation:dicarboxylase symporter family transporter [Allosphingosinicella indica]SMF61545.1 Na+/H+-dicarboxylate symporter [Allosphingosinicella indica]